MRVLICVSNWPGHYFHLVPMGWALQAAGHDVRVACPPGQSAALTGAGLHPVPVLDALDMMYVSRMIFYLDAVTGQRELPGPPAHPLTGQPVHQLDEFDVLRAAPTFFAELKAAKRRSCAAAAELASSWRPDLVLHDMSAEEGALAAAVRGVPAATYLGGLIGTDETDPALYLGPDDFSGSFARHHLPSWERNRQALVIDPSPAPAPPVGTAERMPVRYVPYNGPGAAPSWPTGRARGPRVTVIWGGSATATYGVRVPALRHAVDALLDQGADVVLTTGAEEAAALGDLPGEVRLLTRFPLHLLLPGTDLVVHNGSTNCLMTAAAAGTPQLSLALTDEQIVVSNRLAGTGAVHSLPGLSAPADRVHDAIALVLADPAYTEAARSLRARLAARPSPADLVPRLVELAVSR